MKLSVIVVSRNRPNELDYCLSTLRARSNDIELFLGYDFDDLKTKEIGEKYSAITFGAERSNNRHVSLLNPICAVSNGDILVGINDDAEIKTDKFDEVICECISDFIKDKPDGICYGICQEEWPTPNVKEPWEASLGYRYACYPVMTRKTFECLGYFMPPNISGPGADICLGRVFSRFDRTLDIPVKIYDSVCENKESHSHYNMYSNYDLMRDVRNINEAINHHS